MDELGSAHGGVVDAHYGSGLSFRDPDDITFFAPASTVTSRSALGSPIIYVILTIPLVLLGSALRGELEVGHVQPTIVGSRGSAHHGHHLDAFDLTALLVAAFAAITLVVGVGSYFYMRSESSRYDHCVMGYAQYYAGYAFPVQHAAIRCGKLREENALP